jgi:hypothetical protein
MDTPMPQKSVTKAKPKPRQDNPEQSKAFVDMAREIGADETGREFRKALKKIAPKKASA